MSQVSVVRAQSKPDLSHVYRIRTRVFVDEQGCPPRLEYANEEESRHFLAYCDGIPCGAARWRRTEEGVKLERFAVLADFRGRGVGASLLNAVLEDVPRDEQKIYLNAQLSAQPFYERFGFSAVGDTFEEAGIMHRRMIFSSSTQR